MVDHRLPRFPLGQTERYVLLDRRGFGLSLCARLRLRDAGLGAADAELLHDRGRCLGRQRIVIKFPLFRIRKIGLFGEPAQAERAARSLAHQGVGECAQLAGGAGKEPLPGRVAIGAAGGFEDVERHVLEVNPKNLQSRLGLRLILAPDYRRLSETEKHPLTLGGRGRVHAALVHFGGGYHAWARAGGKPVAVAMREAAIERRHVHPGGDRGPQRRAGAADRGSGVGRREARARRAVAVVRFHIGPL